MKSKPALKIVKSQKPVAKSLPEIVETADEKLVDDAIGEIKAILRRTMSKGMEEIGAFLLKTFYSDDLELFHSNAPTKHASLRSLAERCGSIDLPVNPSFLSNAIRMAVQSRALPADAKYHQLPPSHRIALLPVTDSKKVEQLADDAIEKDMTVVKLRERVAKLRSSSQTPRGRPRVPAVVRALTAIQKLLIDQETGRLAFLRANIDELNDDQRADLRLALDRASELLERLNKLVGK